MCVHIYKCDHGIDKSHFLFKKKGCMICHGIHGCLTLRSCQSKVLSA